MKEAEVRKNSISKKTTEQNKVSKNVKSQKIVTDKQARFEIAKSDASVINLTKGNGAKSQKSIENELTLRRVEEVNDETVTLAQGHLGSLKNEKTVLPMKLGADEIKHTTSGDEVTQKAFTGLEDKEVLKKKCKDKAFGVSEMKETAETSEIDGQIQRRQKDTSKQTEEIVLKHLDSVDSTNMTVDTVQADVVELFNKKQGCQNIAVDEKHSELVEQSETVLPNGFGNTGIHSPAIYLSFHPSSLSQVSMVRRHLKMAGYECWVDTGQGQTGSGDGELHAGIQEAKVVVCCLTKMYLISSDCCKEVCIIKLTVVTR